MVIWGLRGFFSNWSELVVRHFSCDGWREGMYPVNESWDQKIKFLALPVISLFPFVDSVVIFEAWTFLQSRQCGLSRTHGLLWYCPTYPSLPCFTSDAIWYAIKSRWTFLDLSFQISYPGSAFSSQILDSRLVHSGTNTTGHKVHFFMYVCVSVYTYVTVSEHSVSRLLPDRVEKAAGMSSWHNSPTTHMHTYTHLASSLLLLAGHVGTGLFLVSHVWLQADRCLFSGLLCSLFLGLW